MCDVDYFKRYNDTYGHCIGDKCLQRIAKAISHAIKRPADLVARYGGEEFLVVLPSTNAEGAMKVAFSIRSEIRMLRIIHATSPVDRYITLSMGIASVVPTPDISSDSLLTLTDDSLYEAKLQGRNHIVVNHTV